MQIYFKVKLTDESGKVVYYYSVSPEGDVTEYDEKDNIVQH
ncbi:hypothetical protein [Staphylococcus croceilyticus]|nr:hypothetical protein [Staphylococcus croceilyticus]